MFFIVGLLFFLILGVGNVNAATRTASVSGNWNSTTTWGGSAVPTSADDVTINNGIAVTVNVAANCNTLTTLNTGGITISGSNSLTVNGLINMARPSSNGTNFTIGIGSGSLTCGSLTMNATTTSRNNIISISTGTITINGSVTTGTTGCQFIFSGAGTLEFKGSFVNTNNPTITTVNGSTVVYSYAGAQTVRAASYLNLNLSGGNTKTFPGATTISGDFSIANGTIANLGTFTSSANTMNLDGEGVINGSWGSSSSGATYKNDTYFGLTSGIINVATSTCISPLAPTVTDASICIGSTSTLSASGAISGQKYKWYNAATGGSLLKTSTNNTDNTYTTPVLAVTTNYWVSILSAGGCESSRTQVTATFPTSSSDDSTVAATNSWIGHVYDGTNFNTYYGSFAETETFDENFGADATCFNFTSNLLPRSIYTETFSVRYRMNSTKKGLYIVDLGSDDGGRLTVDGTLLCNNWTDQSFTSRPRVLMSLNGSSSIVYDFYENGGANRIVFQNLTLVLANTLTNNISQSICLGNTGTAISGDTYGTLPTGITLSGTGYQWVYSLTPAGTRTAISGATGATFTPNTTVAPFNVSGTYYVYRNTLLSSANNVSPSPYIATNESNAVTIIVNPPMPTTPGAIVGNVTQCPGLTGQTYSISAVPNTTTYTWTVPTGWSITAGAGTVSVTVSTGIAGQNGNITVKAR